MPGTSGTARYNLIMVDNKNAYQWAQEKADMVTNELRRPGRKINVMSDEEWNRKAAAAAKKHAEQEARLQKERQAKQLAREEALKPFQEKVDREKKFPSLIEDKLGLYHEPADTAEEYSEEKWKTVYKQTAPFLAQAVLAYRYGIDKDCGKLAGGDLGYFGGHNLAEYLQYRELSPNTDEVKFFETLLAKKFEFPKFLTVALTANIEGLAATNSLAETVDLLEFILTDEVTQIEITELVLE
ncbi:hypothetical protein N7499_011030 [Penicillium canescens]|nr:hypothetical protein N7499_011030 [Penicillium canescens]KAJ6182806.1 hypothetical protein N7485_001448 [Penicillium canescens]